MGIHCQFLAMDTFYHLSGGMKRTVFILLNFFLFFPGCNSPQSAQNETKSDSVYKESGNFSWSDDGRIITLEGLENRASQYHVDENKLFRLNLEGNGITGNLAENYHLFL